MFIAVIGTAVLVTIVTNKLMERTGLKAKIRLVVAIRFAFALLLFFTFAINVFSLLMQIQEGKTLLEERRV